MRFFNKRDSIPVSSANASHPNQHPPQQQLPKSASASDVLDPRRALAEALQGGGSHAAHVLRTNNNNKTEKTNSGSIHHSASTSNIHSSTATLYDNVSNGQSNGHDVQHSGLAATDDHNSASNNRASNGPSYGSLNKKSWSESKLVAFFNSGSADVGDKKKKKKPEIAPLISDGKVKMYHWQSEEVGGGKKSSADDMVLLSKINEVAITANLKKRFMEDKIYTYIGPVLVAINPFKQLECFGEREVRLYQGAAQYEVPPHIYALADNMYRNMLIDNDSQCVIISGESGAGKTVSAKLIMNYMTQISGGGTRLQRIKDIILKSNPLLEAFGNAKTTKNNNSSRFGKYIEIQFSKGGEPLGGKVSNFLLEKSRVHFLNPKERNFHIFYQLCTGAAKHPQMSELGMAAPDYYHYLSQSSVTDVDGEDDGHNLDETLTAMTVMGLTEPQQLDILRVVAGILHLSNVTFEEDNNNAYVTDPSYLEYPAFLLGISPEVLGQKLVSRVMESVWGGNRDRVEVTFNQEKAQFAKDAWAKGLYARLFDYIITVVNCAMATDAKEINIGILDIYGFEVFEQNGFEQFCINYVNEKLQQIFIELTLKSEQEEYKSEGIAWKPIEFFNNSIVCELIEAKRPVGIMCVLDDTCATMNAVSQGADQDFRRKMDTQLGDHPHYMPFKNGFTIKHYAGSVSYHIDGFCEKNRDVLNVDIIEAMQSSQNEFIRSLFPDKIADISRGRPTTVGSKIKTQANQLVSTLMQCVPHYIRCIKPNETKKPHDWEHDMVKHQVEYLGLKENIKIKRAGFAYRRPFHKFLSRYAILTRDTWPEWKGKPVDGIMIIMQEANMDNTHFQLGKTKVFVKDPESLYLLEECRERKFDHYARIIQAAFKKYYSKRRQLSEKEAASALVYKQKERRRYSIHRAFHGDYIGVPLNPTLLALVNKREKILFALTVDKFDRVFRAQKRDLIVTSDSLLLVGREKAKDGPNKGRIVEVIKRKFLIQNITQICLSTWQDDMMLISVRSDYASLLQVRFKTELLLVLSRALAALGAPPLNISFENSMSYTVRKTGWRGGSARKVLFTSDGAHDEPLLTKTTGNTTLTVRIARALPSNSRPANPPIDAEISRFASNFRASSNSNGAVSNKQRSKGQNSIPTMPSPVTRNNLKNVDQGSTHSRTNNSRPSQPAPQAAAPGRDSTRNTRPQQTAASNSVRQNQIGLQQRFPAPPSGPAPENQPSIAIRPSPPNKPLPPKPIMKPKVRALYSYDARDSDELTFEAGDILELVKEDPSGWWTCRLNHLEGFCPGNYVEKI